MIDKILKYASIFESLAQVLPLGQSEQVPVQNASHDKKQMLHFRSMTIGIERKVGWERTAAINVMNAIIEGKPIDSIDREWAMLDIRDHYPNISAEQFKEIMDRH